MSMGMMRKTKRRPTSNRMNVIFFLGGGRLFNFVLLFWHIICRNWERHAVPSFIFFNLFTMPNESMSVTLLFAFISCAKRERESRSRFFCMLQNEINFLAITWVSPTLQSHGWANALLGILVSSSLYYKNLNLLSNSWRRLAEKTIKQKTKRRA